MPGMCNADLLIGFHTQELASVFQLYTYLSLPMYAFVREKYLFWRIHPIICRIIRLRLAKLLPQEMLTENYRWSPRYEKDVS